MPRSPGRRWCTCAEGRAFSGCLQRPYPIAGGADGLDEVAGFPPAVATPLLPAPALVTSDVLDALGFDEGYRGNAYRAETDFFIRATRRGFACLLTPRRFFWDEGR